jgi:hypothetical protein
MLLRDRRHADRWLHRLVLVNGNHPNNLPISGSCQIDHI